MFRRVQTGFWGAVCAVVLAAVAGGQEPEVMDGLSAPLTLPVVPEGADATGNGGEEDLLVEPAAVPFAGEITDQELQWLIDAAVEERLAGIPRPRYIPATDLIPPRGLLLHADKKGRVPFALSLGGFMQLRWFEFARGATEWTESTGKVQPISNINTFNINRFLISFNGYVLD